MTNIANNIIPFIMCEEKQEFDPRDLNKDGKVSFKERMQDAAQKAGEALNIAGAAIKDEAGDAFENVKQGAGEVFDKVKQGTDEVIGKVKDYANLSPEERKERNEAIADRVADAARVVYNDAKESAEKLFKKKDA